MINLRCVTADAVGVVIIPPFGSRPNVASPRSISLAYRESITLSSNSRRRSCGLDHSEKSNAGGNGRIAKDGYARCMWCELLEQFGPFPADAVFEPEKSGCVTPRASQAADEACPDRISDIRENDRDAGRDPLEGRHG